MKKPGLQETKSDTDKNEKCGPNQITPDEIDSNSHVNKQLQSDNSKDEDTSNSKTQAADVMTSEVMTSSIEANSGVSGNINTWTKCKI